MIGIWNIGNEVLFETRPVSSGWGSDENAMDMKKVGVSTHFGAEEWEVVVLMPEG
jgi:hypothetical protein